MMDRIIVSAMLFAVVADAPAASVDMARLSSIVREPASDEYQGRAPGTPGGRKTVDYPVTQFRALGLFFRADHFPMARGGVPVLLIMQIAGAADLVGGGRQAGRQWIYDHIGNCCHQTCDAWDPDWDLRGAAQDIELFRMIIEDLGNSRRWPDWKAGSEFKAVRDQSADQRGES